jgi:hypothetical protein
MVRLYQNKGPAKVEPSPGSNLVKLTSRALHGVKLSTIFL